MEGQETKLKGGDGAKVGVGLSSGGLTVTELMAGGKWRGVEEEDDVWMELEMSIRVGGAVL